MNRYSKRSETRLSQCHPDIQRIFRYVLTIIDHSVLTGHRNKRAQNKAFKDGYSEVQWPDGNHNSLPSTAIDIAPWPIDWEDRERFVLLAGFVMGVAQHMGISLRWGGNWAMDWNIKGNKFDDLGHFELIEEGV